MDSFFSLFDPTDGQNKPKKQRHKKASSPDDTVKKKTDLPKSRRSNKKSQGKNETLPEESSFLCDPNLSTDILVKDGSYIESFIANNDAFREDSKDKKPKRKNSNRKNRRKKNKISPAKELTPIMTGWSETADNIDVTWNNKSNLKQKRSQEIGKNVNDLQRDVKKPKDCKHEDKNRENKDLNNIIDNFEKIGILDDDFLMENINCENFTDFYSSDDMDESVYDSSSDLEDSGEENFGCLPPEPRFGNVEYKLQLVDPSEKRFQHLVTQPNALADCATEAAAGEPPKPYLVPEVVILGLRVDEPSTLVLSGGASWDDIAPRLVSEVGDVVPYRVVPYISLVVKLRVAITTHQPLKLPKLSRVCMFHIKIEIFREWADGWRNGVGVWATRTLTHWTKATAQIDHSVALTQINLRVQLKWRLRSGGGSAVYVVGVRDSGALRGLSTAPLRASLRTLHAMAGALDARVEHVAVRKVAARRAVAEVTVRKLADSHQSVELRVAVMGANEAGKSTLIGVLTQGELDNGRGSARLNMFRHVHEVRSGRTSSLSHEILGFDAQGNVVNYGCSELMTAERIGERSARLVSFLDLAGHHKYQRTTVHGLTGYSPHYAMLVVSATAGVSRMCEEHIGLLLALDLPFSIVVTKIDMAPGAMDTLLVRIREILDAAGCNKRPLLIADEHSARTCVSPPTFLLDSMPEGDAKVTETDGSDSECIPVFPVSCVKGGGLNTLHAYLLALEPPSVHARSMLEEEPCEFQIDEIFHVGESAGPVVGGLLARGRLREGDDLLIGPLETGEFVEISVKSIYRNRVPCGEVKAGQSASLGLSAYPPNIRQGMVLIAIPNGYHETKKLNPTPACYQTIDIGNHKTRNDIESLVISKMSLDNTKKRKNRRRTKDKNILQDLANVENCLVKDKTNQKKNMYKSDSESDKTESISDNVDVVSDKIHIDKNNIVYDREKLGEGSSESEKENCNCHMDAFAEDPSYPTGSMFFQATVRVLRHSTAICPGFQATVHIGNIRQTAVIEGIMSWNSVLRAGESAPVLFRFVRQPEYVRAGRTVLFRAGLDTRGVGRVSQAFPYPHHVRQ
ncbi:GTP-binding protein 2 [Eumeta japonica]|uniref:GTP-binding protein 2 n=1 Tax=Eumeta variegata TaxID=151549 RepID=A0A4C1TA29_EUMVA|nr:GTP-binding protein 2 [Eumeta japonica]